MSESLDTAQLIQGIVAKTQHHRIVFWYDADGQFEADIAEIGDALAQQNSAIVLINLKGDSLFRVKKLIERDQPHQHFVLYSPNTAPPPEKNPLLDILLYSTEFHADPYAMILNQLGITNMALRDHIQARQQFFRSKERQGLLKRWLAANETEDSLDLKLIAVTVSTPNFEIAEILLAILTDYVQMVEVHQDLNVEPKIWKDLVRFNLIDRFWVGVRSYCGYHSDQPSIQDLVQKLFCTDLWINLDSTISLAPINAHFIQHHTKSTIDAFMRQWRDDRKFAQYYNQIASRLDVYLGVQSIIQHGWQQSVKAQQPLNPQFLIDAETFLSVDLLILSFLKDELLHQKDGLNEAAAQSLQKVISRRVDMHWSNANTDEGKDYRDMYLAFHYAIQLMQLRHSYQDGFNYPNAKAMYQAYERDLFQFDQSYRRFNEYADPLLQRGLKLLEPIDVLTEEVYTDWYLNGLGLAWDKHLDHEKLMDTWKLDGIPTQQSFYKKQVDPLLAGGRLQRVFVIVSDALRYEVAEQFAKELNLKGAFEAKLGSQLGVLPSYTQLGKAALLPHQQLSYKDKDTAVYVDGMSSEGADNRTKILKSVNGLAVDYPTFNAWGNSNSREYVKDYAVIYIFQNTIDDIGDARKTQHDTINACKKAIDELKDMVQRLSSRFNASRILITADHGFLYQQSKLNQNIKNKLPYKPENTIELNKRFVLGKNLVAFDECWFGSVKNTADADDTLFLLPRNMQRFHFVGGEKFVHGGAMLQEVCVPVVEVKPLRTEQRIEKKPVEYVLQDRNLRFTNTISFVRMLQTSAVSERVTPITVEFYVRDGDGGVVSSKIAQVFDASAPAEFEKMVRLSLIGQNFDRHHQYYLVGFNQDTKATTEWPLMIDLAIMDDFF